MTTFKNTHRNNPSSGKTTKGVLKSSVHLPQYASYILVMVLGYALMTCTKENIEPPLPSEYNPVDNEMTNHLEKFSVIREFETGDMRDLENGPSESRWNYFSISGNNKSVDYLNTTVIGEHPFEMYFSGPELMIEDFQENDQLKITWKVKLKFMEASGSGHPVISAGLEKENNTHLYGEWSMLDNDNWVEHTQYFPINREGLYQPFFICQRPPRVSQMTVLWKDIRCVQVRQMAAMP